MTDSGPILVLGAGGHAKVVIDALAAIGATVVGIADPDPKTCGRTILNVPVIGGDETVEAWATDEITLANGVGSTGNVSVRREVFERFHSRGYDFETIIHPSAIVSAETEIGVGAQIMAGVIIQPGTRIGLNTIVNTGAQIDHDGSIGDHVHISPGAVLSGTVSVGSGTHIGAGATIIQDITIGDDCLVAAGAVVTRNLADGSRVAGVPARSL